jgi:RNA ligase (TIGR02306 family)
MSSLVVEVVRVDKVREHAGATQLEIAEVLGWQVVVKKGEWQAGDLGIYFPLDTVLPAKWTDEFGVTKYCQPIKYDEGKYRIRCAKLRGESSFGLLVPVSETDKVSPLTYGMPGDDVTHLFGAEKYIPPVKATAGDAESDHPLFVQYTDIESLRNFPDIFELDEHVIVFEKVDGMNVRLGIIEGIKMAGSHTLRRKEPEDYRTSLYWAPWLMPGVTELMEDLAKDHKVVILFGEAFGPGIQSLQYDLKEPSFLAFDLYLDGRYVDVEEFFELTGEYGVRIVPEIRRCCYSVDRIREIAGGKSLIARHIKEGVVVRPVHERTDPRVGRCILKWKSDEYLLGQKEDFTDV